MTHIAIQEARNGKVVEWMKKVSDKQYQTGLEAEISVRAGNDRYARVEDHSLVFPCRLTISLIQIGAKGEVQPLETG